MNSEASRGRPAPVAYLFFLTGAKQGKIVPCRGEVIRIGRQYHSEIPLDPYQDLPASGDHARVLRAPTGQFFLEDVGSTWGTYLNEQRLTQRVPITTGDVILCGRDDAGREGPRLKFYLESDVLRCPGCEGPVHKRHFRCPGCGRKHCMRCLNRPTQTCARCAGQPLPPPPAATTESPQRPVPMTKMVDLARVREALAEDPPTRAVDPLFDGNVSALPTRRPPTVPCERCHAPLLATHFFVCESCRERLCDQHRHPSGGSRCERCE